MSATRPTTLLRGALMGAMLLFGQGARADNTVTWPTPDIYNNLDPASAYDLETLMLGNVYETLTFYRDGKVLPRLATGVRLRLLSALPDASATLLEPVRSATDVIDQQPGSIIVAPRASQLLVS